ncbi:MAG TPA: 50S ribosomal protein L9 [Terriglobales bacterium]|nr:50S ribosomal protein L9 [Terriglobales bacterium]
MEIILREDVPNLGTTGEIVKVKPGFARNYLFPRGLAVVADRRNVHALEHNKRQAEEKRERDRKAASSVAERINSIRLSFTARAGEEGKLFGSITTTDIERALGAQGVSVERRRIRLEEPIRSVGEHRVTVYLAAGVEAQVTVTVEAASEAE